MTHREQHSFLRAEGGHVFLGYVIGLISGMAAACALIEKGLL